MKSASKSKKRILLIILCSWLFSIVISVPEVLFLCWNYSISPPNNKQNDLMRRARDAILILSYMGSLFLVTIMYTLTSHHLYKRGKEAGTILQKDTLKKRFKVVKMLIITTVVYHLCTLVKILNSLLFLYGFEKAEPLSDSHFIKLLLDTLEISWIFLFINSGVNSFIYIGLSSEYRRALRKTWKKFTTIICGIWRQCRQRMENSYRFPLAQSDLGLATTSYSENSKRELSTVFQSYSNICPTQQYKNLET